MTRKLFPNEEAAIARFAADHGRTWKATLTNVYWYNARVWRGGQEGDGAVLHGLRNDPNWNHVGLDKYRLPPVQSPGHSEPDDHGPPSDRERFNSRQ
jgi:hypothetical protein